MNGKYKPVCSLITYETGDCFYSYCTEGGGLSSSVVAPGGGSQALTGGALSSYLSDNSIQSTRLWSEQTINILGIFHTLRTIVTGNVHLPTTPVKSKVAQSHFLALIIFVYDLTTQVFLTHIVMQIIAFLFMTEEEGKDKLCVCVPIILIFIIHWLNQKRASETCVP